MSTPFVGGTLVLDEHEAKMVREIVDDYFRALPDSARPGRLADLYHSLCNTHQLSSHAAETLGRKIWTEGLPREQGAPEVAAWHCRCGSTRSPASDGFCNWCGKPL